MKKKMLAVAFLSAIVTTANAQTPQPKPFTIQQILSAPYALDLIAAPVGAHFAWIENAEGSRNIWVGGPHETARKITPYTEDDAQDINGMVWSPDASSIAYAYGAPNGQNGKPANPAHLQRDTTVHIIVQPIMPGEKPIDLGEGYAPLFARDGKSVFFLKSGEIYSADLHEGMKSAHRVVIDRARASQLTLSPDGNELAYVSHRGRHSFIGLFDLRAKTLTFAAPGVGQDFAPAFSPDGTKIAWLRGPFTEAPEFAPDRISADPWSVMWAEVAHPDEGHTTFDTPEKNKIGSVLPHTATGDPRLYWLAATGNYPPRLLHFTEKSGWLVLVATGAANGQSGPVAYDVTMPKSVADDPIVRPDGKELIWSTNAVKSDPKDIDRRHLWQCDLTIGGFYKKKMLTHGSGIEAHPVYSADGTVLAALVSDGQTPMHPALIGNDGSITSLHVDAIPRTYPTAELHAPEQVLFDSADGLHLHAQLFLPPSSNVTVHPALIFTHGGPERQMLLGYPSMEYYSNAYAMNQYLASHGFVVLSVNYRCGIGYGLDFRQCVHSGADGASEYNDVLAAQRWLVSAAAKKIVNIDPKRIGLWGGSYGGYLTALGLARNSDLFAAGVDFHGVHEWDIEDNASADWLRGSLADQEKLAARSHLSSPMDDVSKWTSPVLLIHGDNDGNVAFNQTPMLADALRAKGVHVETLIFPDEIHEFLLHKDWLKAYGAEAAFFEKILKP